MELPKTALLGLHGELLGKALKRQVSRLGFEPFVTMSLDEMLGHARI